MTWSIVAVDTATGEAGVAVASCVALDVVADVPGIAPGGGALVTQSYLLEGERDRGVELLEGGLDAGAVLARLLDPAFDPDFAQRQIAVIDARGGIASYTGPEALAFAGHASREAGTLSVAVQGNVLTGREVVEEALAAALAPSACDVPARLLSALEAGGRDGRGDARCTPLGVSAQSATLRAGAFEIDVGVAEPGGGEEPLATLRSRFDELRLLHPCPREDGAGGVGESAGTTAGSESTEPPRVPSRDGDGCTVASLEGRALDPSLDAPYLGAGVALAAVAVLLFSRRRRRPDPRHPSRSARCRSPR